MVGENSVLSSFDEVQRQNRKVYDKKASYKSLKHMCTIKKHHKI